MSLPVCRVLGRYIALKEGLLGFGLQAQAQAQAQVQVKLGSQLVLGPDDEALHQKKEACIRSVLFVQTATTHRCDRQWIGRSLRQGRT